MLNTFKNEKLLFFRSDFNFDESQKNSVLTQSMNNIKTVLSKVRSNEKKCTYMF